MASGGGFFGMFNNYSKPGKGVRKDEPKQSRFVHFWVLVKRKFWKLIQLNLLYLLFCIPIVTIGPATAALTYVLRLYSQEQPVFLFSDFWDAFKSNWKQSAIYGVMALVFVYIVTLAIRFYSANGVEQTWMYALLGLCAMILIVAFMAHTYINLMMVTLDLKLRYIIKNGFLLAILCLKTNAITLVVFIVFALVIVLFFPITIIIMLLLGFSFINFVFVYNAYPGIKKFAIDPFVKQEEEEIVEQEIEAVEEKKYAVFMDEYDTNEEEKEQNKAEEKTSAGEPVYDEYGPVSKQDK